MNPELLFRKKVLTSTSAEATFNERAFHGEIGLPSQMEVAPRYTLLPLFRLFPDYEFGKAQYAFYPIASSHFAEEKKVLQKYQKFIWGDPYKLGKRPLDQQQIQTSNIREGWMFFWILFKLGQSWPTAGKA